MSRPAWHDQFEQLLSRFGAQRGLARKADAHGLADLLLRRNGPGDRDAAAAILEQVLAGQQRQDGPDQGRFPMRLPETWVDLNGTLFLVPHVLTILEEHADLLNGTPPLLARSSPPQKPPRARWRPRRRSADDQRGTGPLTTVPLDRTISASGPLAGEGRRAVPFVGRCRERRRSARRKSVWGRGVPPGRPGGGWSGSGP